MGPARPAPGESGSNPARRLSAMRSRGPDPLSSNRHQRVPLRPCIIRGPVLAAGFPPPQGSHVSKEPIYLTAKGLEKIKEELRYLKEVKRQELADYMGSAIADGDLRESAAYDEARLLQSANETRIADLEEIIHRAVVVERDEDDAVAALGASMELEDERGQRHVYHLVGTHEADIFEN